MDNDTLIIKLFSNYILILTPVAKQVYSKETFELTKLKTSSQRKGVKVIDKNRGLSEIPSLCMILIFLRQE